jgi:membrane protein YqaA with SNARE-associated domain
MFNVSDKVIRKQLGHPDLTTANRDEFYFPNGLPMENVVYVVSNVFSDMYGVMGIQLVGLPVIHKATSFVSGWRAIEFERLEVVQQRNLQKDIIKND